MSHLRLVTGTAVSGAAGTHVDVPVRRPVKGEVDTETLENQARAVIAGLKPSPDGKSVEELLAEMNHNWKNELPPMLFVRRNEEILRTLLSIGIHPHASNSIQDVALYGLVMDSEKLLKACPALKPCASILKGLLL